MISNFTYNQRRQLLNTTVVRGAPLAHLQTDLSYDDAGNLLTSIDGNRKTTAYNYSASQKLLTQTFPVLSSGLSPSVVNTYDERGWLQNKGVSVLPNQFLNTVFGYDAAGHLATVTDPLTHTTQYGYDPNGQRTSVKSPLIANQTTQYGFNARGEQTSVTDPSPAGITYGFDDNGNLLTLLNRKSKTFTSTYYDDNRLWTSITPKTKTTTRTYNKRGLLETLKDPNPVNQTVVLGYDERGRLKSKSDGVASGANGSVYTYDANNNLRTHVENGKTITRTYDELSRVKSYQDENSNLIQYEYDDNGNLTKLTYPDGVRSVSYQYDSNNRLTTVTDWATPARVTSFSYDLAGRMTGITRFNGTSRTVVYDAAGQTSEIREAGVGGTGIAYVKLNYDEAGRIKDEFSAPIPAAYTEPVQTMGYDEDNRIASFNGATVTHDDNGNMTSGPLNSSTLVTHGYDKRNRLISVGTSGAAPALTYGYDSEGNRTIVTGAQTTQYVIDPVFSRTLTRTVGGVTTYYVYGPGLLYEVDVNGNAKTYHYDSRGSTVALTSNSGAVTDRMEYSPYGTMTRHTGTSDTPFLYNGRFGVMTDANGLLYMRARYYNPYLKRFLNADPIGMAGGMNWYAYADGNPISNTDPFGLCSLGELSQISGWMDHPGTMPTVAQMLNSSFAGAVDLKFDEVSLPQAMFMTLGGPPAILQQVVSSVLEEAYPDIPVAAIIPGGGRGPHLNGNGAVSRFGIYEIEVNGDLLKVGKADLNRITQSSGLPTRLHQQVRTLEKVSGVGNVEGRVVEDLGQTTSSAAKAAEYARIQQIVNRTGNIPPGNQRSFKQ